MRLVLLFSGDPRLFREKRVGERFCKEVKAGKNGLACLAGSGLLERAHALLGTGKGWRGKKPKTNIYLAFSVY